MELYSVAIVYVVVINVIAYMSMGIDKKRAIKKKYRISEKALFIQALLGGSLGSILGMKHFHHKTRHWYFKYGMPLILGIQLFGIWLCIQNLKW